MMGERVVFLVDDIELNLLARGRGDCLEFEIVLEKTD